jgi:hypothetical protein
VVVLSRLRERCGRRDTRNTWREETGPAQRLVKKSGRIARSGSAILFGIGNRVPANALFI